jgi:hypothetical protein
MRQFSLQYVQFLGESVPATPLWGTAEDQPFSVTIDNTSIFTPGSGQPQFGFRRTELIAQQNQSGNRTAFDALLESGQSGFHFSLQADTSQPLNFTHEYQVVFIEPNDGTHVFEAQLGTMCARRAPPPPPPAPRSTDRSHHTRDPIQYHTVGKRREHDPHPFAQS